MKCLACFEREVPEYQRKKCWYRCVPCASRIKRRSKLLRQYGLSLEDYERMLKKQRGRCAICRTDQCETGWSLAVDHCHKTGRVRGLLCRRCNQTLGKWNDDPKLLRRALHYLQGGK